MGTAVTDYDPLPDLIRVYRTSGTAWRAEWLCSLDPQTLDRALKLMKIVTTRELVESLREKYNG